MIADSSVSGDAGVGKRASGDTISLGRLIVPGTTSALLFDMDGVLLDTLSFDYGVVNDVLAHNLGGDVPHVSKDLIRSLFALSVDDFFRALLDTLDIRAGAERFDAMVRMYESVRRDAIPAVHDGILAILNASRERGIRRAVVSNNPEIEVRIMLQNTSLLGHFDTVVGNDRPGLARKPAPDSYLEAATVLGVEPATCVVIEDSLLGAEAGHRAGCHTVGVATGGASLADLKASAFVDAWYANFGDAPQRKDPAP